MDVGDLSDLCVPRTLSFLLDLPLETIWDEARFYFEDGIYNEDTRKIIDHFGWKTSKQKRHLVFNKDGSRMTLEKLYDKLDRMDQKKSFFIETYGHCVGWKNGEIYDASGDDERESQVYYVYEVYR